MITFSNLKTNTIFWFLIENGIRILWNHKNFFGFPGGFGLYYGFEVYKKIDRKSWMNGDIRVDRLVGQGMPYNMH